ncbi:MAG: GDP-mannose 4,6-dehydratase [Patescibacteria group bacterium]
MKRVLITGITGFAGSHLAEYLCSKKEYEISGTYLLNKSLENVDAIRDKIHLIKVDLTNAKKVLELVEITKPDLVFNMAGLPSTADSFKNPAETLINNISLEINLLSAIKENKLLDAKILIISSAEIYGLVKKEDLPIDEETRLMPTSPYSVSKIAQDFLGLQYFLSYNLKIIRVRPFNHIGPRQSSHFVVAAIAKKIAEIEKGKRKPILAVGNLESKRDFTDVRDMVRAYAITLEKGQLGQVYNIGSGVSHRIYDILHKLLLQSRAKITVKSDKSLFRPIDNPELVCDASKFKRLTNWKPEIELAVTLKDTLDYWRNIV